MLDEIRARLEDEIGALTRELNVELPDRIQKAVELGDLRENSEYKSALERQQFVQARIGHLTSRVSELSKIDVTQMPVDRVGFGSKVEIHDLALDERLSLTVVAGDYMDLDGGHVSLCRHARINLDRHLGLCVQRESVGDKTDETGQLLGGEMRRCAATQVKLSGTHGLR